MLINFLGTFNSGKTTIASKLFSILKEANYSVEFVPEQARLYIADERVNIRRLPANAHIELFNYDQLRILQNQYKAEKLMIDSCGPDTIIVTDSSVWNSLLYMDDDFREHFASNWLNTIADFYSTQKVVTFLCSSVPLNNNPDPNRIHDVKDLDLINSRLNDIFGDYDIPRLSGDINNRIFQATAVLSIKYDIKC